MRRIENLIFLILILGFGICYHFWRQKSQFQIPESSQVLFSLASNLRREFDSKEWFIDNLEFQSDLDNNQISGELRRIFEQNEISLSGDASAWNEEKGSLWRITDKNQTYIIRKEGQRLEIYTGIAVSAAVRKNFTENKIPLSEDATVVRIQKGKRWRIVDPSTKTSEKRQFSIRREKGALSVYRGTDLETVPPMLSIVQPKPDIRAERDIFELPWGEDDTRSRNVLPINPTPRTLPTLSTILWSDSDPQVIIDGEILGLDETDLRSLFRVKEITPDSVKILDLFNPKEIWLNLNTD